MRAKIASGPMLTVVTKETRNMNVSKNFGRRAKLGLVALVVGAVTALSGLAASPAVADFGLREFDITFNNQDETPQTLGDGVPATQAGSHPIGATADIAMNYLEPGFFDWEPDGGDAKDLVVEQIPGLAGDATAVPRCSSADFGRKQQGFGAAACPDRTAVGVAGVSIISPILFGATPVFNLEPPPGVPVRIGFSFLSIPVIIDVGVNQEPPYNIVASVDNVTQSTEFYGSQLTLWGIPADPIHDPLRGKCVGFSEALFSPEYQSEGNCPTDAEEKPFLTLPTSCTGPATSRYRVASWLAPESWVTGSTVTHDNAPTPNPIGFTGCDKLGFAPAIETLASTDQGETSTGFDFNVDFKDEGLTNSKGLAESTAKRAVVTLPEGVTINPSIGEGLGVCTPADIDREAIDIPAGGGCPNSSKIGTLHIETPLVDEGVDGSVFLAQQDDPTTSAPGAENPFDSLIALYLVLKSPNLGVLVKQSLKVEPDPRTGQLVATLDNVPQLPFSHFNFHFREGQRAPLVTPAACGTYTTEAKFYPWSDPTNPRTVTSSFEVTQGVNGGPCPPGGVPPFKPQFRAGALNNNAGSFSPFNMQLIRSDGEQNMTKFSSILPPGQVGSLVGIDKCPDAAVDIAKSKTGRQELASPSCPANSLIGHTLAGAGVGGALTYVGGQVYLGGPYKGAPLSVISITPAVAGPFDAGTVAVRLGLDLNPKTAEVEVDGAASDPIPHILKGIVLKLRDLRVYVDRPNFILNPTSCDESSARATLFGSYLDVFNSLDDVPVDLATRYQAANCLNLGFKPKLNLNLKGGTKRGGHPGLKAIYRPRKGDANVEGLVVRLSRSAFLDQAHIRTICTRVQFAADSCPKAARYGYIKAWTPLLEEPLQGPVWLRSSNNKLPDLVFDLHGLVDVEVATRIDSAKGGIRATVEDAPDAPLSKVELRMQGGKKGLIINSRNLCDSISRANVQFSGHNGKQSTANPVMRAVGCGGQRKR